MSELKRPTWDEYFLKLATEAAKRSSCSRRQVGAIIVVDKTIASTGYNGTPTGTPNCNEGGCPRCASDTPSHAGYETCFCVHAEINAIALAARIGCRVGGGILYTTLRPCLSCLKASIQAGVKEILFSEYGVTLDHTLEEAYWQLVAYADILLYCTESYMREGRNG